MAFPALDIILGESQKSFLFTLYLIFILGLSVSLGPRQPGLSCVCGASGSGK